jgi:hypothetical protein
VLVKAANDEILEIDAATLVAHACVVGHRRLPGGLFVKDSFTISIETPQDS